MTPNIFNKVIWFSFIDYYYFEKNISSSSDSRKDKLFSQLLYEEKLSFLFKNVPNTTVEITNRTEKWIKLFSQSWILTYWCSYFILDVCFYIVISTCAPYAKIINIFKIGSFPSPCFFWIHPHDASGNCSCVFDYMKQLVYFLLLITVTLKFINCFRLHSICHVLTICYTSFIT